MSLHEHDGNYTIRVGTAELMSTKRHESEFALGELGVSHLKTEPRARVLVGGLGLGFTLRAALGALRKDATVVVAELMPAVVEWNQNPAYGLAAAELADPRTHLVLGDVYDIIRKNQAGFDSILLDADNNTTAMTTAGNKHLYAHDGLALVYQALKPGGIAVYWSVNSDPKFLARMSRAGFHVTETKVGHHVLQVGSRPKARVSAPASPRKTRMRYRQPGL